LNYSLLGQAGKALFEQEPYVEEAYESLEDSVILIRPDGLSIFYRYDHRSHRLATVPL
jgi:hypothetical protein